MSRGRILFLCTGNSCRSQMAEAIVNARMADRWEASSAGSKPAGYVHRMAIQVLSEIGISHKGKSKSIQEFYGQPFDMVVTLCADAEDECPVWLGKGTQRHIPFPDPAKVNGSEAQQLVAFRAVRDDILKALFELLVESKR